MARKFLAVILALVMVLGCAAGAQAQEQWAAGIRIGYSELQASGAFGIAQKADVYKYAEMYGAEIVFADADGDVSKQLADIEDFVAQGVDYIFIHAVDMNGYESGIEMAAKAGIPIILLAREINAEAGVDYATYICSDGVWEGAAAMHAIAKACGEDCRVIELSGQLGSSVGDERSKGFNDCLKNNYPGATLVASQTANFSRAEAQTVTENLIQSTGGQFDAVFAANDEMALGALQACRAAGLDVVIIGVDAQKSALESIQRGGLYGTVTHSPLTGWWAFWTVQQLEEGKEVPIKIVRKEHVITLDNLDDMWGYAI